MRKRPLKRKRRIVPQKIQKKAASPKKVKKYGFVITYDDDFNPHDFELTKEITSLLNKYEEMCRRNPRRAVRELRRKIQQFPKIPQLKNYLVTALRLLERTEEAFQENDKILEEHPDYLFAITNKVIQYWERQQYDKIPPLLGGEPISIQRTFPNRKLFYVMEVFNYYKVLIYYWAAVGNKKKAKETYEFLEDIQPGHEELFSLRIAMLKGGL